MRAARTLDGFTDEADIDSYLTNDIEILKLIRAEAAKAKLQRVIDRIDYKRSHGHNWID